MFKMILAFLAFWGFISGAIGIWRQMENKERWSLVKICAFGFTTAVVTFAVLTTIVILF